MPQSHPVIPLLVYEDIEAAQAFSSMRSVPPLADWIATQTVKSSTVRSVQRSRSSGCIALPTITS